MIPDTERAAADRLGERLLGRGPNSRNSKMPMSGRSGDGARRAERLVLQGFARGAGKGIRTPDPLLGGKGAEGSGIREIGCQRDRAEHWGVSGGPEQAFAWGTG